MLSSGNLPGFPWDSRPKLLHLPLILETLGVYLFPSNHGSVIFSKKRHDISLLERTQNSNGELFTSNSHKFCNRHPPVAINLKVIDGPLEALSIRVMLTTAQENLQFLGRTENCTVVLSLDVHDWCDHGDTKEVGLKLAQENIIVEKCMSISVERTKYVEVLYLQSQRRFTWQLTPTFSYPSVLIPAV